MARIIIPSHGNFTRAGVVFEPRPMLLDPADKCKHIVGVAEDVPLDVVQKHFARHPSFRVEYTDDEKALLAASDGAEPPAPADDKAEEPSEPQEPPATDDTPAKGKAKKS